ncbi:MAG TPA: hypothetical protein PKY82_12925 [Pyrinomonadaceae bacterium]|nr:hypothetical protein [Pyrinomonadaceae bacterium]
MRDKRQLAIRNNNELYRSIFANHKIVLNRTDLICYTIEKTPLLYSNLVTISKDWAPDEIFEKIDLKFIKENWLEWSIKDSFAVLDLHKYNFLKLFDAQWFYLEAGNFTPTAQSENLSYKIIDNESDLAVWRTIWDSDDKLGKEIFNPKLLNNPLTYFVAGLKDEQIVSGCLINKSDDVLSISNFFAPDKNIDYWSEMISFIFSSIEQTDIVGYQRNDLVDKLKTLGFEAVGNLIVWLKKQDF